MKQPQVRNQSAAVAPVPERCATASGGAASEHSAAQAAERLRRISDLLGELGRLVGEIAGDREIQVAAGSERSVMSPVAPLAIEAPPKSDLLTTADLTALLGCHPRTLRRLELLEEIPAPIRKGRRKLWPRVAIDEWLANGGGR